MPFDALTAAALADELREKALGGRIQGCFLPAPLAIGLEIYAHGDTRYLFASAHPQHARVHLAEGKLARGTDDVTPLLLLLRKYVRDGRLAGIEQPPLERTLTLIITKADVFDKGHAATDDAADNRGEPPLLTTTRLIIEIMGRYSNIILVDEAGTVVEAVKHVSSEINRYRVTLPRHPYVLPPPQDKADPRGLSSASLAHTLRAAPDQPAWQTLMRAFRGVSPLLAREIVFRAAGAADALGPGVAPDALALALAELVSAPSTHAWAPSVARQGSAIIEYAPYQLRQFGAACEPAASISGAIHAYYAQETVASDYAGLKQDVQKAIDVQRMRAERRKESFEKQKQAGSQAERLRTAGEMLLAYAAQVTPGQSEVMLETAPGEPPLRIALEPRLTAVENAQAYFRRYAQARDAARAIPPLLAAAELERAYLDQLQLDLDMAKTSDDVREVRQALAAAAAPKVEPSETGKQPNKKKGTARQGARKQAPFTFTSSDGMEILVGRNARQNEHVTFELAAASDVWLHARGVAGSHVIVRCGARPVSPATLSQAAALAAGHSAARTSTTVAVDYTQRRNVRRARGGGPGMVTYVNEKTMHVRPAP